MCVFFLGANRRWVLVFVLLVLWTNLSFTEATSQNIDVVGPANQADLELEFSGPPPSTAPCCEVSYSALVTNHGPDSAEVSVQLDFLEGILESTMGCLNNLQGEGVCELGPLPAGDSRPISFRVTTTGCDPTNVRFRGLAVGSVPDPVQGNHELSLNTLVGPDLPPTLEDLQPVDGTVISIDEMNEPTSIDFMVEVTDAEEEGSILKQNIEWRSDRVILSPNVGSPITVQVDDLGFGGHKITATITDRCDNTVSDSANIGIAPSVPITAGTEPIEFDAEGEQSQPDIASIGSDNFVVVWSAFSVNDRGENVGSIRAQRFNSLGEPIDLEIQVNEVTNGLPREPSVAGRQDGSFVVVWEGPSTDPNVPSTDIFLRQFNSQGGGSDELQVNTFTAGSQSNPNVASRRDGSFLVAWESAQADADGDVIARYFDSFGNESEEFQVNTYTTGTQEQPDLISTPEGGFFVAWQSQGSFDGDDDGYSIQLRPFDEALTPLGREEQVNQSIEGDQTDLSLDGNLEGRVVAVWKSTHTSNAQKRTLRIAGVTRDPFGNWSQFEFDAFDPIVLGEEKPLPELSPPDVAMSPDGDFVAIWANEDFSSAFLLVQVRPFFGLDNAPQRSGAPVPLDRSGIGFPAIAYNHSESDDQSGFGSLTEAGSTNFFAFWETAGDETTSTLEGTLEAMDIEGNQLSLAFPPRQANFLFTVNDTPDPVIEGGVLTYSMHFENQGPSEAQYARFEMNTSANWTFLAAPGCSYTPPHYTTCELGTVQAGEVRNLVATGLAASGSAVSYSADLFSSPPGMIDPVHVSGVTSILPLSKVAIFFDGFESGNTSAWSASQSFVNAPNARTRP